MHRLTLAPSTVIKWCLISMKFSGVIVRGLKNKIRWNFNL